MLLLRARLAIGLSTFSAFALGAPVCDQVDEADYHIHEQFEWQRGGPVTKREVRESDRSPLPEHLHEQQDPGNFMKAADISAQVDIPAERVVDSLWSRGEYRDWFFNLTHDDEEHPCFKGFRSLIEDTDRCNGWQRPQPEEGAVKTFLNRAVRQERSFTMGALVGGNINIWFEEGTPEELKQPTIRSAELYANVGKDELLRPAPESASWMEHECKVFGSLPFVYTCSNRLNVLMMHCGFENAFVSFSDYLSTYPAPANSESGSNTDLIFYLCHEIVASNPNPYKHANLFAHEVAHVIQGGFGYSFNAMTEGGATWLEGALLGLPPRPMTLFWGWRDWNRINAAHFYVNTHEANSRKAYQIHAMFLTYLMQDGVMGVEFTSAIQNYGLYDREKRLYGRGVYDYFLTRLGQSRPSQFEPVEQMDIVNTNNPFAEAIIDYRVALTSACITNSSRRPTQPMYSLPAHLADQPYWDCTAYRVFWANTGDSLASDISTDLYYGGAAVYRLATPHSATVTLSAEADAKVRTKVLASGDDCGNAAEVQELTLASPSVSFTGDCARDIYVVQVNVDPAGEVLSSDDLIESGMASVLRSNYACAAPCEGQAWAIRGPSEGQAYPNNFVVGLQTQKIALPANSAAKVSFFAMWDIEEPGFEGDGACGLAGWDGVQIRVHTFDGDTATGVNVVRPVGGYGNAGPDNQTVVRIFKSLNPTGECADWEGWYGKSANFDIAAPNWLSIEADLAEFEGQSIKVELFFASDANTGGLGFYVDGVKVMDGDTTLYDESAAQDGGLQPNFDVLISSKMPTAAGALDSYSRVPLAVGYPEGHAVDTGLLKMSTRKAPWSASWATPPAGSDAQKVRQYIGYSYSAPIRGARSHFLRSDQEACVMLQAPFEGTLRKVELRTAVDKIGYDQVSVKVRDVSPPHGLRQGYEELMSDSPLVYDESIHIYSFEDKPPLPCGESFLICTSIGRLRKLPADGDLEPFLHLPLTEQVGTGVGNQTLLLAGSGGDWESTCAPWGDDWTLSVRAEVVGVLDGGACPAPTPAPALCPAPAPAPTPGGSAVPWVLGGLLLVGGAIAVAYTASMNQGQGEPAATELAGPGKELIDEGA